MRDRGFILRHLWVHPADWDQVSRTAGKLREKREP
jgi:hypothetical protein